MAYGNVILLLGEAALYFCMMAGLFRLRRQFGLGVFVCALGSLHFLETYLAAIFYMQAPFGTALHVSGSARQALEQTIAPLRRDPWRWGEVPPTLEDVFIHLMREHGGNPPGGGA